MTTQSDLGRRSHGLGGVRTFRVPDLVDVTRERSQIKVGIEPPHQARCE